MTTHVVEFRVTSEAHALAAVLLTLPAGTRINVDAFSTASGLNDVRAVRYFPRIGVAELGLVSVQRTSETERGG